MTADYWLFVGMVLLPLCAYCALAGFLVGRGWGRGAEAAELPPPPPPIVPDFVPESWGVRA